MDIDLERMTELANRGMPLILAGRVVKGLISEEDAWLDVQRRREASEMAPVSPDNWPAIDVQWDLDRSRFFWSMDGSDPQRFAAHYPQAILARADIDELHNRLNPVSKRTEDPQSDAYKSKTSQLLGFLKAGGKATPPLILLQTDGLSIAGGNHRFGWARYRRQGTIPILVLSSERLAIQALVPSLA